jgi:hypothetical protein
LQPICHADKPADALEQGLLVFGRELAQEGWLNIDHDQDRVLGNEQGAISHRILTFSDERCAVTLA